MIFFIKLSIFACNSQLSSFKILFKHYLRLFIEEFGHDLFFYKWSVINTKLFFIVSEHFTFFYLLKNLITKHSIISETYCEGFSIIQAERLFKLFSVSPNYYFSVNARFVFFICKKSMKKGFLMFIL
jgi:hypothetical protein